MTLKIKAPLNTEAIKTLLNKNKSLLFILTEQKFKRTYIINLQKKLPDYLISQNERLNQLIIIPSISTNTVLENLNQFYKCIELFDKTAHHLMNLMAITFNINLSNSNELYDLKMNISERQRGNINEYWQYHFHGGSCSFTNNNTKQFLDIKIIYGLEYGGLDNYFLLKFIQTTESLKEIRLILNDESKNLRKVIEVLRLNEYIIELPDNTLILNRNKKPTNNKV